MSLLVEAPRKLRALLRSGLTVRLKGFPSGSTRVSVRVGGRVVATKAHAVRRRAARIRFKRQGPPHPVRPPLGDLHREGRDGPQDRQGHTLM